MSRCQRSNCYSCITCATNQQYQDITSLEWRHAFQATCKRHDKPISTDEWTLSWYQSYSAVATYILAYHLYSPQPCTVVGLSQQWSVGTNLLTQTSLAHLSRSHPSYTKRCLPCPCSIFRLSLQKQETWKRLFVFWVSAQLFHAPFITCTWFWNTWKVRI